MSDKKKLRVIEWPEQAEGESAAGNYSGQGVMNFTGSVKCPHCNKGFAIRGDDPMSFRGRIFAKQT